MAWLTIDEVKKRKMVDHDIEVLDKIKGKF